MIRGRWNVLLLPVLTALVGGTQSASACAVCFGAPDSALTKGMAWGILSLLAIIGCVLAAVAVFFIYLARRASTAEVPLRAGELAETTTHS